MRRLLGAVVAGLVVACGAFGASDPSEPPADATPDAAAAAGADAAATADGGADASLPKVSVACEGIGACEGSHTTCCTSGITGATNTCNEPGKCPSDQPYAFLCDDATDCIGAGFPEGTRCCGALRGDLVVIIGSRCVTAAACPAPDIELCEISSPKGSACTNGACRLNTTKTPKLYAYCQ